MGGTDGAFAQWLSQVEIAEDRLTAEQRRYLLQAAFCLPAPLRRGLLFQPADLQSFPAALRSLDSRSHRSYSLGRRPAVAHSLAALAGISSKEGGASSRSHRMAGRPCTANCCRSALRGPIAEFIPDPCRRQPLRHFSTSSSAHLGRARVSTVALHHFCKKFGLDRGHAGRGHGSPAQHEPHARRAAPGRNGPSEAQPVPPPPPRFSTRGRSDTRGRSC